MPRKVLVLPSRKPRSLPLFTCTTGGFRFGESGAPVAFAAPDADAGSSAMPASVPLTTAAPPNSVRRFINTDSGDLRLLIHSPGGRLRPHRRQSYPNLRPRAVPPTQEAARNRVAEALIPSSDIRRMPTGRSEAQGSGNVYTDLGYRDSEGTLVKAQLAAKIAEILQRRALTQARSAEILGSTQSKVSALLKGRFRGISE